MRPTSLKLEKARQLAAEFPNTGNAPLSNLLIKQNPDLYQHKEDARTYLRRARGSNGKKHRTPGQEVKHFPNGTNAYTLPPETHNKFEPIVIKTDKRIVIGILGDLHFPYQDNKALTTTLNAFKETGVSVIIFNGDVMDCYMESDFVKDPNKRNVFEEVRIVKSFLISVREQFPNVRIIYKEGNHEFRHKAYLARKAPEIFGFEQTHLHKLLGLDELNIEWVDNKRSIELGKLSVLHGHEFGSQVFTPVSPAKTAYAKAEKSIVINHYHQVSSYSSKTLTGKQQVAYSIGCLCDLTPEYHPYNKWSHGFMFVELFPDDTFIAHNKKIVTDIIMNG
jgi:predicted phosphodiesterase